MFNPKTYAELCTSMQAGAVVHIDGVQGYINGIRREDGTGRNWLVDIAPCGNGGSGNGDTVTKFVRLA